MKLILHNYSWIILFVFLISCSNQDTPFSDKILTSPATFPTSQPTSIIPAIVTPSPLPTQPTTLIITPDPIQVERWKEYQDALAEALFSSSFIPGEFLCEWEILGQSDQEIYVWTVCTSITPFGTTTEGKDIFFSSSIPAVIYFGEDGVVQKVEIPGPGTYDYDRMFPPDIQAKFEHYRFGRAREMSEYIDWRRMYPEEPPLIVLSSTPVP